MGHWLERRAQIRGKIYLIRDCELCIWEVISSDRTVGKNNLFSKSVRIPSSERIFSIKVRFHLCSKCYCTLFSINIYLGILLLRRSRISSDGVLSFLISSIG